MLKITQKVAFYNIASDAKRVQKMRKIVRILLTKWDKFGKSQLLNGSTLVFVKSKSKFKKREISNIANIERK